MEDFNKRLYDCFNSFTMKDEAISEVALKELFFDYIEENDVKYFCNNIITNLEENKIGCYRAKDRDIAFNYDKLLKSTENGFKFDQNITILYALLHELTHANQVYFLAMVESGELDFNSLDSITKLECVLDHYSYLLHNLCVGDIKFIDYPFTKEEKDYLPNVYNRFHDLYTIERLAIIDGKTWIRDSLYEYEKDEEMKKLYEDLLNKNIYYDLTSGYDYFNTKEEHPIREFFNVTIMDDMPKLVSNLIDCVNYENNNAYNKLRIGASVTTSEYHDAFDLYGYYVKEYKDDLVTNSKIKKKTK